MAHNPNQQALPQVLDLMAEIGRPLTAKEITDILRLNDQTTHKRLRTLRDRGLVMRERGADPRHPLWSLRCHDGQRINGFTRHNPVTALPALERAVRGWYVNPRIKRAKNGE